jgi:hypothetical protein
MRRRPRFTKGDNTIDQQPSCSSSSPTAAITAAVGPTSAWRFVQNYIKLLVLLSGGLTVEEHLW